MVCLSDDNFENNFYFATIVVHNPDLLKSGKIGIKFVNNKMIDVNNKYEMLESEAYFEVYCYVLKALQVSHFFKYL